KVLPINKYNVGSFSARLLKKVEERFRNKLTDADKKLKYVDSLNEILRFQSSFGHDLKADLALLDDLAARGLRVFDNSSELMGLGEMAASSPVAATILYMRLNSLQ